MLAFGFWFVQSFVCFYHPWAFWVHLLGGLPVLQSSRSSTSPMESLGLATDVSDFRTLVYPVPFGHVPGLVRYTTALENYSLFLTLVDGNFLSIVWEIVCHFQPFRSAVGICFVVQNCLFLLIIYRLSFTIPPICLFRSHLFTIRLLTKIAGASQRILAINIFYFVYL
ncbi:hypothetical protein QBC37DRAFT_150023 [Rhypophila decipiens]|uniref:Uncharacterized protein n=1 Tax=Rhypophila decipiens TaxID=261697 RepID=A0AAN6Y958_9PEZI|nr:hypothetical protein QBC37DRAFT_150023 [Rhypophila decipiens]